MTVGEELTMQQAADLLNVPRQYLLQLLEAGRIPCVKVDDQRVLRVEDVLAFKETRDRERRKALPG